MAIKSGWTERNEVLAMRVSRSHPGRGIEQVKTTGYNQEGTVVIEFKRTLMVYLRAHAPALAQRPPFLVAADSSDG